MIRTDFSLERLEQLYERRADVAWAARRLPGNHTFWRHDVDYSIDAALRMAEWERERGVRSTYYLMHDNPFYGGTLAMQARMRLGQLGHEVGWHVDTRRTPVAQITVEIDALGRRWGGLAVSFHCPRPHEIWVEHPFRHAYAPHWEGRYYSDSRGAFAYGDPEYDDRRMLQINLHPEWWFEPDWHEGVDPDAYEGFFHEPIGLLAARS